MKNAPHLTAALAAALALATNTAFAAPVSQEQATKAVENYLSRSPAPLEAKIGGQHKRTRTFNREQQNTPLFHVVALEGGGFVVTSADTGITPIIAISEGDDLIEDARNPLWVLLNLDLQQRMDALGNPAAKQRVAHGGDTMHYPPEQQWESLLTEVSKAHIGAASISDVRVEPLVQSQWNQSIVGGKNVYNYYTPNNYVCGCVATAGAQIMRFHQYPTGYVTPRSYSCEVDDVSVNLTMKGGIYDWANMPLVPTSSITDTQREAIGRLTYDIGVTARASYGKDATAAYSSDLLSRFKNVFGYSAGFELYIDTTSPANNAQIRNALLGALDAGLPTLVCLLPNGGHLVIADGYGYHSNILYAHLNMGWGGSQDAWYNLEALDVSSSYHFTYFGSIIYNISPTQTGEWVTGRALDGSNAPLSGVTVTVRNTANSATYTATTSAKGIYAVNVPSSTATYEVSAVKGSLNSPTKTVSVQPSSSSSWSPVVGNSWGNDLTLGSSSASVLGVTPDGKFISVEGASGTLAVAADGTWSVTKPAWVNLSATSGSGNATLTYTVTANTTSAFRQGTLAFTSGGLTANMALYQSSLTWFETKASAMSAALAGGKKVVLLAGRPACGNCCYMHNTVMESSTVKPVLKASYVLWFCDVDNPSTASEYWTYASGLGSFTLPLICIIDPANPNVYLDRSTATQSAADFLARLNLHKGSEPTPTLTTLQNGVPVTGLSDSEGSWRHYKIAVPPGASLEISMSGGTGDADLYVKRGAQPTLSDYHYRPYSGGNNETVTVNNPVADDWYISIHAYEAYSGVTLIATYTTAASVSVAFNGNNGTPTSQTVTQTVGENYVLPPSDPTRTGYTFAGWFTATTGGTQVTAATTVTQTSAHTLYAQWTQVSQAGEYIVIDLSGGTSAASYPVTTLTAIPSGGWTDEYKTTKLVLRRLPAGTFIMGSPEDELGREYNETQHQVTLTQDFHIGVFQVTQRQYELVMGTNPSFYTGDARPVQYASYNTIRGATSDGINWPDTGSSVKANTFLGRMRARTGLAFDLPTEAQWEYACRAGTTTALNSGKNLTTAELFGVCPNLSEVGRNWHNRNDGKGGYTDAYTKVGMYLPNNWGLYDMHGNVWEWCLDWYNNSYGTAALTDPKGPATGSNRILRGGGYNDAAYIRNCRSASRGGGYPDGVNLQNNYGGHGLRLCAQVAAMVTVTFNGEGGIPASTNIMQVAGGNYVLPSPDPTWPGYTFTGWFTATTGGTQVTAATTVTQASAHTLYARWTAAASLGEALNNTALTWTTGGDLPWFAQTQTTHDGLHAAQSGAITHNQSSWIETTVTGPGTMTFWWRVSSESGCDFLDYRVNGTLKESRSGTTGNWAQETIAIPAGVNTVRWTYRKDGSVNSGSDCGWLDEVTWTPTTVIVPPTAPTGVTASQGTYTDRVVVSWSSVSGATSYKVYRNTSNNSGGASQIGMPSSASYTDTGAVAGTTYYYWVKASNNSGDSGFSVSAQGWRASGDTPPSEYPYLSDPEVTQGAAPFNTTAYNGFIYDGNNTVHGTLTLNAKVNKAGVWTVSAKAVMQSATISFSGTRNGLTDISLHKNGSTLTVRVEDNRVYGTLSGGAAGGTFTVDGAKDYKSTRAPGLYNVALGGCTDDADMMGYISLNVGNAGAVKYAGQLADGTKVSGSAKLLTELNRDGWYAVALFKPLYSKNGFLSGLLWLNPADRLIRVDWENDWFVDWKKASGNPDRLGVGGGYFGTGKQAVMPPLGLTFGVFVPDNLPHRYDFPIRFGPWNKEKFPLGLDVFTSGAKLSLAKKGSSNPSGATLSYNAKTGVFKGKFSLFSADSSGREKATSVPYSGVMVPQDDSPIIGEGIGTATINKVKFGIPVFLMKE